MSTNTLRMVCRGYDEAAWRAAEIADPFGMRDARTGMKDSPHECTTGSPRRRPPRLRRVPTCGLRVVLPQRDRTTAGHAGRDSGRHPGRVRDRDEAKILTAELDPKLAGAAARIFEDDPQVEVRAADWSTLTDAGPFSLLYLDSGDPRSVSVDAVADLVEEGGIVVLDDFTPCEMWPPVFQGRVDTLREEWLTDDRFTTVDVMVAPDASTLIATKR
jgi:hypothetical protein